MNETQIKIEPEIRQNPIGLFFILEDSRHKGDFARAAEAQKELLRLGIVVRYKRAKAGVNNGQ
jgi:hypothetical protein